MSTLELGVIGNCAIASLIDRHVWHGPGRLDGDPVLELFNNVLGRRNHVGLLPEDIDPKTGELWGNFPQTCSQVGLILSAMRLSRTWEEGLWHAS